VVSRKQVVVHRHENLHDPASRSGRDQSPASASSAPPPRGSVHRWVDRPLRLVIGGAFIVYAEDAKNSRITALKLRFIDETLQKYREERGDFPQELKQLFEKSRNGSSFFFFASALVDPWGMTSNTIAMTGPQQSDRDALVWTTERRFLGLGPQRKLTNRDVPN